MLSLNGVSLSDDTESAEVHGDGGRVDHKLAEAALQRRGNAETRRWLQDQERIYNAGEQKTWEQKYKFFSARHMERSYRLFTRARHDPFNKDPVWGKSIISKVAQACSKRNIAPESLFRGVDVTGDGNLNRPEMKRVVVSILPALSDEEITAIFDTVDSDHSGEVNVKEFCQLIEEGKQQSVPAHIATRWRNPIHRITRMAPAQIEGWDHLEGDTRFKQFDKICDTQQIEMQRRLGETLMKSSREIKKREPKSDDKRPKYQFFCGGGDTDRFRRAQWRKDKDEDPARTTPRILDPGPYPKPGWMYNCDLRGMTDSQGTRFSLPRTPHSAR
jgi:hypothetical protein